MQSSQLVLPLFSNISMSLILNTPVLLGVLVLFLIVYVLVSMALMYHWSQYGMHSGAVILAETVFTVVSLVLFTVSFLALDYF